MTKIETSLISLPHSLLEQKGCIFFKEFIDSLGEN